MRGQLTKDGPPIRVQNGSETNNPSNMKGQYVAQCYTKEYLNEPHSEIKDR